VRGVGAPSELTSDGRNFVGELWWIVEEEERFEEVEVERENRENEEAEGELGRFCCEDEEGDDFGEGEAEPRVKRLNFEKRLFVGVEEAFGDDAEELFRGGEV
jgi:hypothetical protein